MPDASSRVTVRRRRWLTGSLAPSFAVLLDGEKVGKVRRGGVLAVDVAPGPHLLAVRAMGEDSEELRFEAEPGRELTFECGYGATTGGEGILHGGLMVVAGRLNKLWVRRVLEGTGDVTVTLPAWCVRDYNEAEIKKAAAKSGFKSAVVNADGSVTYTISEARQQEKLAEIREAARRDPTTGDAAGGTYAAFLNLPFEPFLREILVSPDMSEFIVKVDKSAYGKSAFGMSTYDRSAYTYADFLGWVYLGTQYQAFSGVALEKNYVSVTVVDAETGDVLDTAESADWVTSVDVIMPASYYADGVTGADKANTVAEMGAESAVVNVDGSVTYTFIKAQQRAGLALSRARIDKTISDDMLSGDGAVASFHEITHDDDMREFTVRLDALRRPVQEENALLRLYGFGRYYQALSGVAPERNRVVVSFVDAETGTVLETFDSNDLTAHEASGPTTTAGEAASRPNQAVSDRSPSPNIPRHTRRVSMSEQLEQWNEECLLEGPSPRFMAVTDRSAEHWLTVVPDDAGDRVVVDGRAFGPYEHVYEDALAVSLVGARAAWMVEEDGSWRVVVDGEPGPLVAETSVQARPVFSPDGRHLAYGASPLRAQRGRSPILLYVDGGEQDRLLAAAPIQYASDGRLCYVEQAERAQRVVVDGEPGPWVTSVVEFEDPMVWATPETRPMTPVTFAPDSASFAYAANVEGGQAVFRDHVAGPAHALVGRPVFSPGGGHLAYWACREERHFLRTIQHPFVVVDDIAGPELPSIVADVDFDADGRVLYLALADDHVELFRDHRPTGTRCDFALTGPHRTPSGRVWFVDSPAQPDGSGSCSMVVDGAEQWSSARASLRDFAVFEMSVQESPDGRRFGYLVGDAGFTDGGEVHLVLDGVKLDMLVDDRWWTRSPGFSPDGRWAAIGVRAEGFSQDDRSRRVRTYPNGAPVGGMRPWVEGQPLGPLADQWAGPWWTATSVRFVGLRGDTLVRAQLSLPGGEAADVSSSNSGG